MREPLTKTEDTMKKKMICLFAIVMVLITALPVFADSTYVQTGGDEYETPLIITKKDLSDCTVTGISAKTYTGKAQTQNITVKDGNIVLTKDTDYKVTYQNNKNAGTATLTITGQNWYKGSVKMTFQINKAENPMTVKAKKLTAKASKKKVFAKAITVKKAKGKVTFSKIKGSSKIKVAGNGKVTVKGLKKGNYEVQVKVTAAGNENYNQKSSTVTMKLRIK